LVVLLSPIEAMFAFILITCLRVVLLYDLRKDTSVTRHSKCAMACCLFPTAQKLEGVC
jgi:hypothetical protein